MKKFELVIAGGGLTAARESKSYRESDGRGQIALLSKEGDLPYHRPALSKRYLRGETTDAPFAEDAKFYRDHDVEVLLETTVTAGDAGARTVTTDAGSFHYEKLLIATGATPRRLAVPDGELEDVYALRTLRDSQAIRTAAGSAERAVGRSTDRRTGGGTSARRGRRAQPRARSSRSSPSEQQPRPTSARSRRRCQARRRSWPQRGATGHS